MAMALKHIAYHRCWNLPLSLLELPPHDCRRPSRRPLCPLALQASIPSADRMPAPIRRTGTLATVIGAPRGQPEQRGGMSHIKGAGWAGSADGDGGSLLAAFYPTYLQFANLWLHGASHYCGRDDPSLTLHPAALKHQLTISSHTNYKSL